MMKNQKEMQENNINSQFEEVENNQQKEEIDDNEISSNEEAVSSEEIDNAQKLKTELEEQKDKYIRLFAEFDNYKRRTSKEAIELRQTAGKEIIVSLLDVLDDMDRAEQQMKESDEEKTLKEGILLVFDKFRKILQSKGLKAIQTLQTEFDVEKDEAVSEIHVDDKKLKGKVVAELQKGYMLNDKLIRFAKVVVGK
ncbi:MAG TPA: nucleotide exchange factor GrpE [Hanamia sp.]|nr:nucleotide exchange factor GrpE [Hanamia sp.]